ncbi:MAG: NgoMIV family type II restriction endonuclease [Kineosporiaceae bacterium]
MAFGPNLADLNNTASTLIAGRAFELMGIPKSRVVDFTIASLQAEPDDYEGPGNSRRPAQGAALEAGLERDLVESLDGDRWEVSRSKVASDYAQYQHLAELQRAIGENPELRIYAAGDYAVKTDVMVGVKGVAGSAVLPLHAAVSSKLTLRSDRAQNVRTEFAVLVRNRRGRAPHLVVVTAEPHPGRLISLARGTGEIDAVYHLLFEPIAAALDDLVERQDHHHATLQSLREQRSRWAEMVAGRRLRPYEELCQVIGGS